MTPEQIVEALSKMSKDQLRKTAELAARMFTLKAENVYDEAPEENGREAQHYADIAEYLELIAAVGQEPEGASPVEDQELDEFNEEPSLPQTLAQAVQGLYKDPWGGR